MIFTLGDDIRVIIIKLADRLHNMRTLDSMLERKLNIRWLLKHFISMLH
ncbi:MAG: HD domain-containing protein [Chitinophagales bacterium]